MGWTAGLVAVKNLLVLYLSFICIYCKDAIEEEASEPYKGSAIRKVQAVPSFLSYFNPFTPELPITASAIPCTACNASVLTAI